MEQMYLLEIFIDKVTVFVDEDEESDEDKDEENKEKEDTGEDKNLIVKAKFGPKQEFIIKEKQLTKEPEDEGKKSEKDGKKDKTDKDKNAKKDDKNPKKDDKKKDEKTEKDKKDVKKDEKNVKTEDKNAKKDEKHDKSEKDKNVKKDDKTVKKDEKATKKDDKTVKKDDKSTKNDKNSKNDKKENEEDSVKEEEEEEEIERKKWTKTMRVGQSYLFPSYPDTVLGLLDKYPLELEVWNDDEEEEEPIFVGIGTMYWETPFFHLIKETADVTKSNKALTIKKTSPLYAECCCKQIGEIFYIVRLSALGESIVTEFQQLMDDPDKFLFRTNKYPSMFECSKIEDDDPNYRTDGGLYEAAERDEKPLSKTEVCTKLQSCGTHDTDSPCKHEHGEEVPLPVTDEKEPRPNKIRMGDINGPCGNSNCPLAHRVRTYIRNLDTYKKKAEDVTEKKPEKTRKICGQCDCNDDQWHRDSSPEPRKELKECSGCGGLTEETCEDKRKKLAGETPTETSQDGGKSTKPGDTAKPGNAAKAEDNVKTGGPGDSAKPGDKTKSGDKTGAAPPPGSATKPGAAPAGGATPSASSAKPAAPPSGPPGGAATPASGAATQAALPGGANKSGPTAPPGAAAAPAGAATSPASGAKPVGTPPPKPGTAPGTQPPSPTQSTGAAKPGATSGQVSPSNQSGARTPPSGGAPPPAGGAAAPNKNTNVNYMFTQENINSSGFKFNKDYTVQNFTTDYTVAQHLYSPGHQIIHKSSTRLNPTVYNVEVKDSKRKVVVYNCTEIPDEKDCKCNPPKPIPPCKTFDCECITETANIETRKKHKPYCPSYVHKKNCPVTMMHEEEGKVDEEDDEAESLPYGLPPIHLGPCPVLGRPCSVPDGFARMYKTANLPPQPPSYSDAGKVCCSKEFERIKKAINEYMKNEKGHDFRCINTFNVDTERRCCDKEQRLLALMGKGCCGAHKLAIQEENKQINKSKDENK